MSSLLDRLRPVYDEDRQEWRALREELGGGALPPMFWYAGAAFDATPFVDWQAGRFPAAATALLSPRLLPVLSDYSPNVVRALKDLYANFDRVDRLGQCLSWSPWFAFQIERLDVEQMIPLRLFDADQYQRLRSDYGQRYRPYHPAIADPDWHAVYIRAEAEGYEGALVYVLLENLLFWNEIVAPYGLEVEAFCALRVGGKSGSWDRTHSPNGRLFSAIRASAAARPRLWIADDCLELRALWPELARHERGFYGQMHFFRCDWSA